MPSASFRSSRPLSPEAAAAKRSDARMRALEAKLVSVSAGVYGTNGPEPLLPGNMVLPKAFDAAWRMTGNKLYTYARALMNQSDYLRPIFEKRLQYFSLGFELVGANPDETAAIQSWARGVRGSDGKPYRFDEVSNNAWVEWLTCDNVVAFWKKPDEGQGLPPVTMLDCEDVRVDRNFGGSVVAVTPKRVKLSAAQKEALGKRWADAIEKGGEVVLDESLGERWEILTGGKSMGGLSSPRIEALCDDLMHMNLLKLGDLAGSWTGKDLITQILKGHEIRGGSKQGMPDFFLKKAEMKVIEKMLQNKGGAFKIVSNFDLLFKYVYLDPKFFDAAKYAGVMQKIEAWAGPIAQMLKGGIVSDTLVNAFKVEGLWNRERVAGFLKAIFNHDDFICGAEERPPAVEERPPLKMPGPAAGPEQPEKKDKTIAAKADGAGSAVIGVEWDAFVFDNPKALMEWVRTGANGLVPPQIGRKAMRVNDGHASQHMRGAHANPLDYTPPFEPRQGMLSKTNGRPTTDTPTPNSGPLPDAPDPVRP